MSVINQLNELCVSLTGNQPKSTTVNGVLSEINASLSGEDKEYDGLGESVSAISENLDTSAVLGFNEETTAFSLNLDETMEAVTENTKAVISSIKTVKIPYGFTEISESAFHSMASIEKIVIPDSVTSIGDASFMFCTSLKELIIPDGVTSIGQAICMSCSSLEKVVIPKSVTTITTGSPHFGNCNALKTVEIACPTIVEGLFAGLPIENLTIKDSVKEIKGGAFQSAKISRLVIPKSVETVMQAAFASCTNLKEIEIMSGDTLIESEQGGAFAGCTNVERIIIHAPENSIEGAPWGATNAEVIWLG